MPATFTNVPLPAVGSSPVVIYGRGGSTCCTGARLDSPRIKWRWWRGRRCCRGAAAAKPRRRSHLGSDFDELWRNVGEQVAVEASLGPRRGARSLGRRWEQAERRAHRGSGNGERRRGVRARGGSRVAFL
jgi:hypothetical protein